MSDLERLLTEQVVYYRERAPEYEDWWFRRGRYDHGPEANARWFAEIRQVEADLDRVAPVGRVLELACGTGIWTQRLARTAATVTALDASPEALRIARSKVPATNVTFHQADLFAWEPDRTYDLCFFSFWLSHVPRQHAWAFWQRVRHALAPGGRAYIIDSARSERASARDHTLQDRDQEVMARRLGDGREYRIIKHWFDAQTLQQELHDLGWSATIHSTAEFFIYGSLTPGA